MHAQGMRRSSMCFCMELAALSECDESGGSQLHGVLRSSGWSYPWGLRVRLCELLLRGVFEVRRQTRKLLKTHFAAVLRLSLHTCGVALQLAHRPTYAGSIHLVACILTVRISTCAHASSWPASQAYAMSCTAKSAQAGEANGSSAAVVQHLQLHVWPLLGIKPDVADALMAWVHFRQARSSPPFRPCVSEC